MWGKEKLKRKKTDKLRSIEDNRIRYGLSIQARNVNVKHVPQCLSGSAPVSEMLYRQKQCILLLLLSQKCINKLNSFLLFYRVK